MSFKFSYQKLLEHRKTLEDVAQRDAAEAKAAVDQCKRELAHMYYQIDEARMSSMRLSRDGGSIGAAGAGIDEFIIGQNRRIDIKKQELRQLQYVEEERMQVLVDRTKDKKILEKLKERRYAQYKKDQKKKELKAIDDIVVMKGYKGGPI